MPTIAWFTGIFDLTSMTCCSCAQKWCHLCVATRPSRRPSIRRRTNVASDSRCARLASRRSWRNNRRLNRRESADKSTRSLGHLVYHAPFFPVCWLLSCHFEKTYLQVITAFKYQRFPKFGFVYVITDLHFVHESRNCLIIFCIRFMNESC